MSKHTSRRNISKNRSKKKYNEKKIKYVFVCIKTIEDSKEESYKYIKEHTAHTTEKNSS